jgi:hypothetical protein
MRKLTLMTLALVIGCGGAASAPAESADPGDATGGSPGSQQGGDGMGGSRSHGAGGALPSGTGGTESIIADAGPTGTGGGAAGGAMDAAESDAATPDGGAGGTGAGGSMGMAGSTGNSGMMGFYEAEAVMPAGPNQLIAPAVVNGCPNMGPNCGAPDTLMPEAMCCSKGGEVRQLLRGKGGLVFNKVAAPADGMYDVTWWYHCGKNDNFGDANCGGEPNHPAAGCRPHILTVNGTRLPKVYEFHCFPGPWGQIHAVTTPLPLKAGDNSIRVVATAGRDAADLDAIAIFPPGKGTPPVAFVH